MLAYQKQHISIQQYSLTPSDCAGDKRTSWGRGRSKKTKILLIHTGTSKVKLSLVMLASARKLWHIREKGQSMAWRWGRIIQVSWSQKNKARRVVITNQETCIHKFFLLVFVCSYDPFLCALVQLCFTQNMKSGVKSNYMCNYYCPINLWNQRFWLWLS